MTRSHLIKVARQEVALWGNKLPMGLVMIQPTPARSAGYNVVVISGCEYIEWNSSTYFLIHKANCTNLIHGHE